MEILGSDGAGRPTLPLQRATREALKRYVELRWPVGRRKSVSIEWDLTNDEARAICEGNPSPTTIDKVWHHPRGGWRVGLPVMGAVFGLALDDFLAAEMEEIDRASNWRAARRATLALVESRIGAPGAVDDLGPGSAADGARLRAGSARVGAAVMGRSGDRAAEVETKSFRGRR